MSYASQDEIIQELAASTGRQWIMLVTCNRHLLGGLALESTYQGEGFLFKWIHDIPGINVDISDNDININTISLHTYFQAE